MATPRLDSINMKFRRSIGDLSKKDGTEYTLTSLSESVSLTPPYDTLNAGSVSNDEISNYATQATNSILYAEVERALATLMKKRFFHTLADVGTKYPEYIKYRELGPLFIHTPLVGFKETEIEQVPEDYIFFASGKSFLALLPEQKRPLYYTDWNFIEELGSSANYEYRAQYYLSALANPAGGLPFLKIVTFNFEAMAGAVPGYMIGYRYLAKQLDAFRDSTDSQGNVTFQDILMNSFYDDEIIARMVKIYENIRAFAHV